MRNGIAYSIRDCLTLVSAITFMGACSSGDQPLRPPQAAHTVAGDFVAALYEAGGLDVLRVKADPARSRVWVLGVDDLRVYDAARKTLMSRVVLPGWFVLQSECMPDVAFDDTGSAFVTDNVQAKLWRIDAASFDVREHDIRLQWSRQWDIGFSSVAFTPNGSLYALSSMANSLWKIDVAGGSAELVEFYQPPVNTCALTKDFLNGVDRNAKVAKRSRVSAGAPDRPVTAPAAM